MGTLYTVMYPFVMTQNQKFLDKSSFIFCLSCQSPIFKKTAAGGIPGILFNITSNYFL